jgi:hypothetical protein
VRPTKSDVLKKTEKNISVIHYTLNEWPKLIRYAQSGLVSPDNNIIENAIRPFVLGRKN